MKPRGGVELFGVLSNAPVAYDMTRLFLGPLARTPRGIDRVDFAFARHVFEHYENSFAILPTIWGIRCFDRRRALAGLDRLEQLWAETVEPEADPVWRRLRAQLLGSGPPAEALRRLNWRDKVGRMLALLCATGWSFGASALKSLPKGTVYFNIGHLGLVVPFFLRWLDKRSDICPVFMVHDAIPLQTPEYVEPGAVAGHGRMIDMAARYAKAMIVTTVAARNGVAAELSRRTNRVIPMLAQPLPVAEIFKRPATSDVELADTPYFVSCGAIEPRKNQLLLVEIWKQMAADGSLPGKLVIVGAPGWTGKTLMRQLQAPALAQSVLVVSGLSTPALIRLMKSARGLLMPSFIEGYGLPIVEAQHLGVPVIASDIAAHREVARPGTALLSPIDGLGWRRAIEHLGAGPKASRKTIAEAAEGADSGNWSGYFAGIDRFLFELAASGKAAAVPGQPGGRNCPAGH